MNMNHRESWTIDEELIVAETMLKQIRNNTKQKDALNELSEKLGRTSQGIGYRWSKVIAPRYENAILIAKGKKIKQQEEEKVEHIEGSLFGDKIIDAKNLSFSEPEIEEVKPEVIETKENVATINKELSIDSVINFLQINKNLFTQVEELEQLRKENEQLKIENKTLKNDNKELLAENQQLSEDFEAFANIMNKARDLFGQQHSSGTIYKTDKNGYVDIKK